MLGDEWFKTLSDEIQKTTIFIPLITTEWLRSTICVSECYAAELAGIEILPIFFPTSVSILSSSETESYYFFRRRNGIEVGSNLELSDAIPEILSHANDFFSSENRQFKKSLSQYSFPIDKNTSPFPGLLSYDDHDSHAAILFGRDIEIISLIDKINSNLNSSLSKFLIVRGISGVGKSSLLKAGILPRLRRIYPSHLIFRSFRPGLNIIQNFLSSIISTIRQPYFYSENRTELENSISSVQRNNNLSDMSSLKIILDQIMSLIRHHKIRGVIITIDQFEEIFSQDEAHMDTFFTFISDFLSNVTNVQFILTCGESKYIYLREVLRGKRLPYESIEIEEIPNHRLSEVISKPAKRYGFEISDKLIDRIIKDAPQENAIPLVAFTLQSLFRNSESKPSIGTDDYGNGISIPEIIDVAAEKALRGISVSEAGLPAIRELADSHDFSIVQSMVMSKLISMPGGVSEYTDLGTSPNYRFETKIQLMSSFNPDEREAIKHFCDWRLMSLKVNNDGTETVEFIHNSVLKHWRRFQAWVSSKNNLLAGANYLHAKFNLGSATNNTLTPMVFETRDLLLSRIIDEDIFVPNLPAAISSKLRGELLNRGNEVDLFFKIRETAHLMDQSQSGKNSRSSVTPYDTGITTDHSSYLYSQLRGFAKNEALYPHDDSFKDYFNDKELNLFNEFISMRNQFKRKKVPNFFLGVILIILAMVVFYFSDYSNPDEQINSDTRNNVFATPELIIGGIQSKINR